VEYSCLLRSVEDLLAQHLCCAPSALCTQPRDTKQKLDSSFSSTMSNSSDLLNDGIVGSPRTGSEMREASMPPSTPPGHASHRGKQPRGRRERPKLKFSPSPINLNKANSLEQDTPNTSPGFRDSDYRSDSLEDLPFCMDLSDDSEPKQDVEDSSKNDDNSWSVTTYSSADDEQDDMNTNTGLKEVSEYANSLGPLYSTASRPWAPAPDGAGAIPACILEHRPCDSTCRHGVFHTLDLARESLKSAMEEKRLADARRDRESQIVSNRKANVTRVQALNECTHCIRRFQEAWSNLRTAAAAR
ncbi:hypothetical protein BKA63DRAFT_580021, partial [Paraphoma chrysanthemicola]